MIWGAAEPALGLQLFFLVGRWTHHLRKVESWTNIMNPKYVIRPTFTHRTVEQCLGHLDHCIQTVETSSFENSDRAVLLCSKQGWRRNAMP